jgi:hypothetical protein
MEALYTSNVLLTVATYWRYVAKLETKKPETIEEACNGVISDAGVHPSVFSEEDKEVSIEAAKEALRLEGYYQNRD